MKSWKIPIFGDDMNTRREGLAWAAGLFEGEGCFSARGGKGRKQNGQRKRDRGLVAKVKMTDEDIVRRFHKTLGVGNVTGPYSKAKRKPFWIWQTGSFEAVQFVIGLLWSQLGTRRKKRAKELLLWFHDNPRPAHAHQRNSLTGRYLLESV
jgi:hypothetical protein